MSDNTSCRSLLPRILQKRNRLVRVLALLSGSVLAACSGGSGGGVVPTVQPTTTQPQLASVQYGRLVDVYGLQTTPDGTVPALYRKDVLVGPDIHDERGTNESKRDDEITYDFTGSDPDTLQPQLFIPRDMTSDAFKVAFAALSVHAREVVPMVYGTSAPGRPFAVVPRNAALQLNFSAPLGIDDSFFVERNSAGEVIGLRNTEAVQLLRLTGDPNQPGGLAPIPVRIVVSERSLILDPVLLGSEGLQYQTRNNAAGLPESPDQLGANIRIALALEGPLAIPRLRETLGLTGWNNSRRNSIVRDFRSGNASDTSADLTGGFVRDPLPLRIVGEIGMYLERVERINAFTQEITVYKNGLRHEIDRGDQFRFIVGNASVPFGVSEVVVDPTDDQGHSEVQHVRVRIRSVKDLETLDPRSLPGYPTNQTEREPWLVANAPRAVLLTEFAAGAGVDNGGDDPRNFITFTPTPLPNLDGTPSAPDANVSPFAGAIIRFTKPVDMATVKWADTFFFAMRDLVSQASIDDFIQNRPTSAGTGMDPASFRMAKYRVPYLITARVFDEDGSQTSLRLQPSTGFYLDDTMRNPPAGADYHYFLHLIANSAGGGVRDLAGNAVDLQGSTPAFGANVVIPFTVDTRMNGSVPFFENNLVVNCVRTYQDTDEDENPSYFLPNEVTPTGGAARAASYPLEDLFGGMVYLDGKLQARPTTRVRKVVDNLNQAPIADQGSILRWCPKTVNGGEQRTTQSAATLLQAGIQNPLNPYGCRLQTEWREVDLSLSRTDPYDFNLDVEQMYWAPFTGTTLTFDEFDSVRMDLGHAEFRAAPCVDNGSSLPSLEGSGLRTNFVRNFLHNLTPTGSGSSVPIESQPAPHSAYAPTNFDGTASLTIDPAAVVYEVNHVNRFLPLPTFRKPYFVYRDETVMEQGCNAGQVPAATSDLGGSYAPYIISPFNNGIGRHWVDDGATLKFANSFWCDADNFNLNGAGADSYTGGLVGSIGLPLLADFWTLCDSPNLPEGNGYVAGGFNGAQISLTVQSSFTPFFRVFSAGRPALPSGAASICTSPGDSRWSTASGGYNYPAGNATSAGDNSLYWMMLDFVKRQNVITSGFIDLNNPHRVPEGFADPRLGPFYLASGTSTRPANIVPTFAFEFDPPLSQMPSGTSVVPQFRGASAVDPSPWFYQTWAVPTSSTLYPSGVWTNDAAVRQQLKPDATNFPLDPFKAGDAHIRKWDTRSSRNWWTYFYNRTVTGYVEDPNQLMDPSYTIRYAGPNETFTQQNVRYVNWRFVTSNNVDANPPVAPSIDTFALSYRFQRVQ